VPVSVTVNIPASVMLPFLESWSCPVPAPLPSNISMFKVLLAESGWAPFIVSKPGDKPGAIIPLLVKLPDKLKVPSPLMEPVLEEVTLIVVVPKLVLIKVPALLKAWLPPFVTILLLPVAVIKPVTPLLNVP